MIKRDRASQILAGFADVRILVIGDLMLDRYIFGSVSRISPEAPVPVVQVDHERVQPGGASNVALNIASLGGQSVVAGIVGDDDAGRDLLASLCDAGIDTRGAVVGAGQSTTVKTRVIADRQQVVRVDREEPAVASTELLNELSSRISELSENLSGAVIEDYGKGVISQSVVDSALSAAKGCGIPVGYDPKENHELNVSGVSIATPNYREACLASGQKEDALTEENVLTSPSLRTAGEVLSNRWNAEFLMITLGPCGMYLLPRDGEPHVVPTRAREVFDVSGAGDTVIAVAVASLAAGATYDEAAALANYAAGVVVAKVGTATCAVDELLEAVGSGGQ